MKITCVSDLHGHYPELPGGDLLILAGDYTKSDQPKEYLQFGNWLREQPYRKKVFIGGNHDNLLEGPKLAIHSNMTDGVCYLSDSGTEFEGLKIWGSPWTKWFHGVNPKCKAFMLGSETKLYKKFSLIPDDVDILVTHSPPFTILDKTVRDEQVGSTSLLAHHIPRLRPKLWVFGHIHEAYGQAGGYTWNNTRYVNASHVNERYEPVNEPITVEI